MYYLKKKKLQNYIEGYILTKLISRNADVSRNMFCEIESSELTASRIVDSR